MNLSNTLFSSITKKQIVAVTGLALILFIIIHLLGNLTIFGGPEAFNGYAKKLHDLGALLWVARIGLIAVFLIHVVTTALLVIENIQARGLNRYAKNDLRQPRSWATKFMPYSGVYIFLYLIWHILDFTFVDKTGARSFLNGESYGIYGIVVNSFADPLHAILYILAMCFVGLHLVHGVHSFFQTLGINDNALTPVIKKISEYFALTIVIAYSSIPVYVLFVLTG